MRQIRTCMLVWGLMLLALATCQNAWAEGDCCQKCGCHQEVKTKLCLVKTIKKIEIPCYTAQKECVHCRATGWIEYNQYRQDLFCSLECCSCSLKCDCELECGCKTLYGAKPSCTQKECCIERPSGTRTVCVPSYRWVAIPICNHCAHGGKSHGHGHAGGH